MRESGEGGGERKGGFCAKQFKESISSLTLFCATHLSGRGGRGVCKDPMGRVVWKPEWRKIELVSWEAVKHYKGDWHHLIFPAPFSS